MAKKNKYMQMVDLGYTEDGRRIRKRVYGATKKDLQDNIHKLLAERAEILNPSDISFQKYAQHWLETYKSVKSPRTYNEYIDNIKGLSFLNPFRVRDITRTDCQSVINAKREHPTTCKKLALTMKQIFKAAVSDGIINRNPAADLDLPKVIPAEKRVLTEAERSAIRNAVLPEQERMFINIMFYFGLRPEECRALDKKAFNLKEQTLTINKAYTFVGNRAIQVPTKTGVVRTLPIPDALLPDLVSYLKSCPSQLLFTMRDQKHPMTKSSFRKFTGRVFKELNRQLGGDDLIDKLNGLTWYTLRHNFATMLYYAEGITTKQAALYMGHSEAVFLKTYSHLCIVKENTDFLKRLIV